MKQSALSFFVAMLFASNLAQAGSLVIPKNVPFAKDSGASPQVQAECNLEQKLLQFIRDFGSEHFDNVSTDPKGKNSRTLTHLEITDIIGQGGGAWSGSKAVTIGGTMRDETGKSYNFKARRYSTGGAFAGFKGTCAILGR